MKEKRAVTRQLRGVLLSAKAAIGFSIFAAGALVAAVALPGTSNAYFNLSGGNGFTITSVVTAYPACSGRTVYLYPGVERCLVYTAHDPLAVPLTVNSLSIVSVTLATGPRQAALPACTTAWLDLSKTGFSGSLVVPALGSASVAKPLTLVESGTNQDNCEDTTFNFVYSGAATYTDTTTTALASSPNPSKAGQTAAFTATITPTVAPPSRPTGTVSFYLCSVANCPSRALLGSASIGSDGQASWSTSTLAAGTDLVEAVYTSPTTDFTGSTSALVSQVVLPAKYSTVVTERVVAPPAPCTGHFESSFTPTPGSPVIDGTNRGVFGGGYFINCTVVSP